eukprot:gene2312-3036_t
MSSASKTQWRLEEIAEGGRNYLLDKETAQIYQASLATIWPQLVGKLINNEVQVSKPPPSLYTALDNYLKDSKQRLKELFDEFDDDGIERISQVVQADSQVMHKLYKGFSSAGSLAPEALSRLLYDCVPNIETKELRHLLMYLKQIDLAGESKSTFKEVLQALRLLAVQRVPGSVPNPEESREKRENTSTSGAPAEKQQWTLERHAFEGKAYLLDRARGKVYSQESTVTWPRLVGQFSSNKVVLQEPPPDLISALDNYLRSNGMRLKEVFDDFDDDNSGTLDRHELVNLVRKVLPHAHAGELSYFQVILDVNGDGRVTYQELIKTIKDCLAIGKTLCEKQSLEVDASLEQASKRILENQVSRQRVLKEFERDGSRGLLPRDVAQLVREILPSFADSNMRHLLLSLKSLDLDGSGRVQSADFMQTLRLVDIRLTESAKAEPPESAATKSVKPSEQWELEEMYFEGKLYLVDRTERKASPPPRLSVKTEAPKPVGEWVLQSMQYDGKAYLLDPTSKKVYFEAQESEWPRLAGHFKDGKVVLITHTPDLFESLDRYLKTNQTRLKDVFNEFDTDNSGELDVRELEKLLKRLLSDITPAQIRYFTVMLDVDGDGKVTYAELTEGIRDCYASGQSLEARDTVTADDVLMKLAHHVQENHQSVKSIFDQADKHNTGLLNQNELAGLMKKVMPGLSKREQRALIRQMSSFDVDGDGRWSFRELLQALRLVRTRVQEGGTPVATPSTPMQAAKEEWLLEEISYGGVNYLIDRVSGKVYHDTPDAQWPELAGHFTKGSLVLLPKTLDLFQSLDIYLKEHQTRLQDVFNKFDLDKNGTLDPREMSLFLKELMPEASNKQVRYFQLMFDLDGDGGITLEELQ